MSFFTGRLISNLYDRAMTNGINVEQNYFLMIAQHANGVGRQKNNIKRKPKISKNAICHFLLLFAAFNPEIPQERHLESKEVGSLSTQRKCTCLLINMSSLLPLI